KQSSDFAEILKNIADKSAQTPSADNTNEKTAVNTSYDESEPMSLSEIDYVKQRVRGCWNVGQIAGMQNARQLTVTLRITLLPDGTVSTVEPADTGRMGDPLYRTAAEVAIRAVRRCSPFDQLPKDKYANWKEMTMTFDPSEML